MIFDYNNLAQILLSIPAVLIALTVHEYFHGYVAYRLGDPTARSLGRLTLNPLAHLDPLGTILMVVCGFGWAKPVPVNPRYFKNPRNGMAITASAGPLSNFAMAIVATFLYRLIELLGTSVVAASGSAFWLNFFSVLLFFFLLFQYYNLCFFVFNLLPIPPFDGSRIFFALLPPRLYFKMMKYERTIQIVLIVALLLGAFTGITTALANWLSNSLFRLAYFLIP